MLRFSKCKLDLKHVDASSTVLRLGCPPRRIVGAICEPAVTYTSACIPGMFHHVDESILLTTSAQLGRGLEVTCMLIH